MSEAQNNSNNSVAIEPLLVGINDAASMLSISRPLLYQMISDGRFGLMGIRFGRKRLFSVDELRSWVQAGCPARRQWEKIRGKQDA